MDTPERSKIGGTPLPKFEDSPIFNFINNLSPIQPVKSTHGAQVFQSLSFASISSVFASPHINSQKESRFLTRHPYSDSSKLETSSGNLDESSLCPGISDDINPAVTRDNCNLVCSLNEATVDPPEECSSQPSNLSQPIQYDCGSPNHNTTPCYGVKIEPKLDKGQTTVEMVNVVHDGVEKRKLLFATEIEAAKEHQVTQNKDDITTCDWEDLISVDADDLLVFDSSTDSDACIGLQEKYGDGDANSLTSSLKPASVTDPCLQNADQYPLNGNNEPVIEEHATDHTPQILSGTFQSQVVFSDENQETGNGTGGCISVDCKVESQQQRGMRRRCLTFDLAGGSTKNSTTNVKLHSSISFPSSRKFSSDDKLSMSLKRGSSSSPRILPSIGLHLNTLATTQSDRMVTKETLVLNKRFISTPCSTSPFPPLTYTEKSLNKSLDIEKDQFPIGSEVRDTEVTHDDVSEAPEFGVDENLCQNSPKKKKRKPENGGESEGCKRCNCKKSKCLKLYCECFAAGIYCVEPCSCHGCFNKPIHEETVLATRKQIESRNPLAFAPKVIRASKPVEEMGEESNKTPASARHKRGCNCKKSSCLKKYCECFQGGVGCSPCCRCEGCRNAFGRKDVDETDHAEEIMDGCEKQQDKVHEDQENDLSQKSEQHSPESILPATPSFGICRLVKPPFLSSGKPPRSSTLSNGYPTSQTLRRCEFPLQQKITNHFKPVVEDDTPEILRCDASPNKGVKTISPNGKRVSPPYNALGISPTRKTGRKLILKSIPSFPSLIGDVTNEHSTNHSGGPFSSSALN